MEVPELKLTSTVIVVALVVSLRDYNPAILTAGKTCVKRFLVWFFTEAVAVEVNGVRYVPDWDAIGGGAAAIIGLLGIGYSIRRFVGNSATKATCRPNSWSNSFCSASWILRRRRMTQPLISSRTSRFGE